MKTGEQTEQGQETAPDPRSLGSPVNRAGRGAVGGDGKPSPLIFFPVEQLRDLARTCGLRFRGAKADCPMCGACASVSFYESRRSGRGRFKCHHDGCDFQGDTLDFTTKIDFKSVRRGRCSTPVTTEDSEGWTRKNQQETPTVRDCSVLWEHLAKRDPDGEAYLRERGLPEQLHDVLRYNIGRSGDSECDRLAGKGYRLAFALRDADGNIRGLQLRLACEPREDEPKTRNLSGAAVSGLVFGDPENLADSEDLFVVEGGTDTLAAYFLHGDSMVRACVVGLPGADLARRVAEALGVRLGGKRILLCTDADAAGDKAASSFAEVAIGNGATCHRLRPRWGKDLAEALR